MSTSEAARQWKDQIVALEPTEFVLSATEDEPPPEPGSPVEVRLSRDASEWLRSQLARLLPFYTSRKDDEMSAKESQRVVPVDLGLHKTRVQLDMSSSELQRLNWIMQVCDLHTRKEVFNVALTLLEWAAKETSEGRKVASFDDQTNTRNVPAMAALSAASRHVRRYLPAQVGPVSDANGVGFLATQDVTVATADSTVVPRGVALGSALSGALVR